MIPAVGLVIGLLVGFLRKGSLRGLAEYRFTCIWLLFGTLLIQILIFPWVLGTVVIERATGVLHVTSYVLATAFLLANVRYFWPILPGLVLNLLVIIANAGFMPSSSVALRRAGEHATADALLSSADGTLANIRLMTEHTRLNLLGDILWVPEWVPLATAFSVGDVLIALGVAWIVQAGMKKVPQAS